LIVGSIVGAILYRASCIVMGYRGLGLEVLPFGCADQLGFGALLAYLEWSDDHNLRDNLLRVGRWFGLPLLAGLTATQTIVPTALQAVLTPCATALAFTWVVGRAAQGFGGISGAILNSRPLLFLGKISYGLYVYHPFVSWAIRRGAVHANVNLPGSEWEMFIVYAVVTIAIATASWRWLETPIKNYGRYLEHGCKSRAPFPSAT
jgi:peptidoglycan/LPS O-acetylase OafA/YrhL